MLSLLKRLSVQSFRLCNCGRRSEQLAWLCIFIQSLVDFRTCWNWTWAWNNAESFTKDTNCIANWIWYFAASLQVVCNSQWTTQTLIVMDLKLGISFASCLSLVPSQGAFHSCRPWWQNTHTVGADSVSWAYQRRISKDIWRRPQWWHHDLDFASRFAKAHSATLALTDDQRNW